jgi:hypothetical protein
MKSKGLYKSGPYDFGDYSSLGLSFGLVLLTVCSFPWQMFHIPGISKFLGSPLHQKSFHRFMHHTLKGSLQGLMLCCTLPDLSGFLLKSGWKFPLLRNFYILCDLKNQQHMNETKVYCYLEQYVGLLGPWLQKL